MAWKNYSDWQKSRIAQLEQINESLETRFLEAKAAENAAYNEFKREERRRQSVETQVKQLDEQVAWLNLENRRLGRQLLDQTKLQDTLATAVVRIKELEKQLNLRSGREEPYGLATPSSKQINKVNSTAENRARRGGAKIGHEGHGRQEFTPEEVDQTVALEVMPELCDCGSNAWQPDRIISHSVYRFIPARIEKCLYRKWEYVCSVCGRSATGSTPGVMPGALFGNALAAHLLTEHYGHGQTVGSLEKRWDINHGSFFQLAHRTADQLEKCFDYILFRLRQDSRLVHADETPWSMDGARGYAWFFGNDDFKVFLFRHTRGSIVPKNVIGTDPLEMVLVTDRYGGYTADLKVARQYCFVHLLRDLKKQELDFPDEPEVRHFAADLKPQLIAAIELRNKGLSLKNYRRRAVAIKKKIIKICGAPARHPAVQYIQNIFREHQDKMFQWVKSPDIPAENNFAERELRPMVIARKISFGSQSERGLKTREILMTILHTARCRGHDPAEFLARALDLLAENNLTAVIRLLFPVTEKAAAA